MSQPARIDRAPAVPATPHRRWIIELLRVRPRRAGEIADAIGRNPPALSTHLRNLKVNGLIEQAHPAFDARVRVYTLRPAPMTHLKSWLEATEPLWAEQLTACKTHLERDG